MKKGTFIPNKVKECIKKAFNIGAMEYIISDIFQKVMVFIGGFIIVRILSKEDYGTYTYVLNVFSILFIFGDFGVSTAVLQYASVNYQNDKKKIDYIRYGSDCLHIVSFIALLVMSIAAFVYPFILDAARNVFKFLIILPIFNNEILYYQSVLRIELKNKEYARINFISTALHYLFLIGLAYAFGLNGAVVASYPKSIIVLIIYICTIKKDRIGFDNSSLTKQEKRNFWKFGLLMQINAASLTLLNYLDIYCLGVVVKNPEIIAEYKVASTIPTAMYFIPTTVMFFMVPIMGRYKNNLKWTISTFKKIIIVNAIICTFVAVIMASLSNIIIKWIYGEQYINSVSCYLILTIGFVVYGILQIPSSNVLTIQEKLRIVLITSICGAVINIVLNILLINILGAIGAAIATVLSHFFVGGILTCYFILLAKKYNKLKESC